MKAASMKTETPNAVHLVSRRGFLGNVFSAGALVLGSRLVISDAFAAETVDTSAWHPSVYLGLEPDGRVIIAAHRSEMGTGIRTCLPAVVADELDADWKKVTIQQAIGDKKYGDQNTDGSNSIRFFYEPMRVAGATARVMLEGAAAAKWNVPVDECHAKNHEVVHAKSGKRLGFGELVADASKQPVPKPETLKFKSPADYKFVGKDFPIADLDDICAGKGTFGMDAKRPGMVYASIERSPVIGGAVKSSDDSEAKKVRGVSQTVTLPAFKPPYAFQALGGVAVIADNTWSAMQGRKKLKIDWDLGKNVAYDSEAFKKSMMETNRKPCKVARNVGDVDAAFSKATKTHEAEYYAPHLSHAPMEPPAAIAEVKGDRAEIWTATQNPQAVQSAVAGALGIPPTNVTCHVTLLGGGFGRKSKPDYCCEAALLAKQLNKPVKVVWSREDDIHFDYYHSVAAMYMKAATDEKGMPVAWLQRSTFPPILSYNQPAYGGGGELSMGWTDVPFDIPNIRAENGPAEAHVRIGWFRSVANIYHAYAVHSFIDELAAAANRDRVEYLLAALGAPRVIELRPPPPKGYALDTARTRKVVELVAEQSGWAKKKSGAGHGFGIAVHRSFLSYIATVVEVQVDAAGKITIPNVWTAADCGMIVNPDRVKAQFEGAAVFGTSLALMGEITATGGKINQSNFNNYPVARMTDAPQQTHVHVVASNEAPAGVGEPGVPPMAPALCNAIFAATGKRIRELPIKKTKLV